MNFNNVPTSLAFQAVAKKVATHAASATTVTTPSQHSGTTNLSETLLSKGQEALKLLGTAFKSLCHSVANVSMPTGSQVAKAVGTAVGAATWTAGMGAGIVKGSVEMGGEILEKMGPAMEKAMPILEKSIMGLGVGLGAIAIYNGVKDLAEAYSCHTRSTSLTQAAFMIQGLAVNGNDSDVQQLQKDLQFCATSNTDRAKDLAISGALDISVGVINVAMAAATHGVSALVVPLVAWGVASAVKTAIQIGNAPSSEASHQREVVTERLTQGLESLKDKISTGQTLDAKDKGMMIALQSVGLIDKKTDLNDVSGVGKSLAGITKDHIEEHFTKGPDSIDLKSGSMVANFGKAAWIFSG